jgi:hypothetical protein
MRSAHVVLLVAAIVAGLAALAVLVALPKLSMIGAAKLTEQRAPVETAHQDGFEIVMVGVGTRGMDGASSMHLAEADSLMSTDTTWGLRLDAGHVASVARALELKARNSDATAAYPFVSLDIKEGTADRQTIDLSYHYSKSTYHYCYEVHGRTYRPLWSSFRTFGANRRTVYSDG